MGQSIAGTRPSRGVWEVTIFDLATATVASSPRFLADKAYVTDPKKPAPDMDGWMWVRQLDNRAKAGWGNGPAALPADHLPMSPLMELNVLPLGDGGGVAAV